MIVLSAQLGAVAVFSLSMCLTGQTERTSAVGPPRAVLSGFALDGVQDPDGHDRDTPSPGSPSHLVCRDASVDPRILARRGRGSGDPGIAAGGRSLDPRVHVRSGGARPLADGRYVCLPPWQLKQPNTPIGAE